MDFFLDYPANLFYIGVEEVYCVYENLKKLRESLSMKQEEFGASVGVKKSTYSNYETGKTQPTSDFWISVATTYEVSIDYLMGFCDDPHGTQYSDGFTVNNEEKTVVKAWRTAPEDKKEIAALALGFEYVSKEKDASAAS